MLWAVTYRRGLASSVALAAGTALCLGGCPRPDLGVDFGADGGGTSGTTGETTGTTGDTGQTTGDTGQTTGDTGQTTGDTGTTTGANGQTTGANGGACPDGDSDGVCDAADNCPTIANPEQVDVCSCALSVTDPVSVENDAFVASADVNGSGQPSAVVSAGSQVTVDFLWATPLCFSSQQHILVGFQTADLDPACAVSTDCTAKPVSCSLAGVDIPGLDIPCEPSQPGSATLTAPSEPGDYYVVVDHREGSTCNGWPSAVPGDSRRIAGVCVR